MCVCVFSDSEEAGLWCSLWHLEPGDPAVHHDSWVSFYFQDVLEAAEASGSHVGEFRDAGNQKVLWWNTYFARRFYNLWQPSLIVIHSALCGFISICQLQPICQQFWGHGRGNSGSNWKRKSLRDWRELGAGFWCCQGKKKEKKRKSVKLSMKIKSESTNCSILYQDIVTKMLHVDPHQRLTAPQVPSAHRNFQWRS